MVKSGTTTRKGKATDPAHEARIDEAAQRVSEEEAQEREATARAKAEGLVDAIQAQVEEDGGVLDLAAIRPGTRTLTEEEAHQVLDKPVAYGPPEKIKLAGLDRTLARGARDQIDKRAVEEYAERYREEAADDRKKEPTIPQERRIPPIQVVRGPEDKLWVIDGNYRCRATEFNESPTILAVVSLEEHDLTTATREACLSNSQNSSVRVTMADRKARVWLAHEDPTLRRLSSRAMAELCGMSQGFITNYRKELKAEKGIESGNRQGGQSGHSKGGRKRKDDEAGTSTAGTSTATPAGSDQDLTWNPPETLLSSPTPNGEKRPAWIGNQGQDEAREDEEDELGQDPLDDNADNEAALIDLEPEEEDRIFFEEVWTPLAGMIRMSFATSGGEWFQGKMVVELDHLTQELADQCPGLKRRRTY